MEAEQEKILDNLNEVRKLQKELRDLKKDQQTFQNEKNQTEKKRDEKIHFRKGVRYSLREAEKCETDCLQLQEKLRQKIEEVNIRIRKLKNDVKQFQIKFDNNKIQIQEKLRMKEDLNKIRKQDPSLKIIQQKSAQRKRTKPRGNTRSWFNYLLLDPRETKGLLQGRDSFSSEEFYKRFRQAVFYIGKGQQARPDDHLQEAVTKLQEKNVGRKIRKIKKIWSSNHGVVSLHCFQHALEDEALNREAYMIEAIGLEHLTNEQNGSYKGDPLLQLTPYRKRVGEDLLRRASTIYTGEGETEIRCEDIKLRKKRKSPPLNTTFSIKPSTKTVH